MEFGGDSSEPMVKYLGLGAILDYDYGENFKHEERIEEIRMTSFCVMSLPPLLSLDGEVGVGFQFQACGRVDSQHWRLQGKARLP